MQINLDACSDLTDLGFACPCCPWSTSPVIIVFVRCTQPYDSSSLVGFALLSSVYIHIFHSNRLTLSFKPSYLSTHSHASHDSLIYNCPSTSALPSYPCSNATPFQLPASYHILTRTYRSLVTLHLCLVVIEPPGDLYSHIWNYAVLLSPTPNFSFQTSTNISLFNSQLPIFQAHSQPSIVINVVNPIPSLSSSFFLGSWFNSQSNITLLELLLYLINRMKEVDVTNKNVWNTSTGKGSRDHKQKC